MIYCYIRSIKYSYCGGAHGVMVSVAGSGHGDTSSNPGPDCISHSTNALGKCMNPKYSPSSYG